MTIEMGRGRLEHLSLKNEATRPLGEGESLKVRAEAWVVVVREGWGDCLVPFSPPLGQLWMAAHTQAIPMLKVKGNG